MSAVTVFEPLFRQFGIEQLYPIQFQVLTQIQSGGDALVVIPTGAGKSLCFQLPAMLPDARGITLVFSPLIALMEDQVAALRAKDVPSTYINSSLDRTKRDKRMEAMARGKYRLVYVTPERMHKPAFMEALHRVPGGVRLLAIDEAHCITRWGHDFRPAYQEIGHFKKLLGNPQTIALTATATPEVRRDIRRVLDTTRDAMPLFAQPIDRPNLSLEAEEVWSDDDRADAVLRIADAAPGTGIVYFSLIRDLQRFADLLRPRAPSLSIAIYHGQLDPQQKKRVYRRFIESSPDDRLLLLATNAFGMGVDKPDIRFVVHAQTPGSVESYYQEVGRAGRDGKPSRCLLLLSQDDLAIQHQFVEWMNPSADMLMQASHELERSHHADFDVDELRDLIIHKNRGDRRAEYTLLSLEKMGVVEPTSVPERYRFVRPLRDEEVEPMELAEKKQRDLQRLLDVLTLARSDDIAGFIRSYFDMENDE